MGQRGAQALVLGDGRMGHALLVLVEDLVGQGEAFPAHIFAAICKGKRLDIFPCGGPRQITIIEDQTLALVTDDELGADGAFVAMAQDVLKTRGRLVDGAMQVVRSRRASDTSQDTSAGKACGEAPATALKPDRPSGIR